VSRQDRGRRRGHQEFKGDYGTRKGEGLDPKSEKGWLLTLGSRYLKIPRISVIGQGMVRAREEKANEEWRQAGRMKSSLTLKKGAEKKLPPQNGLRGPKER